MTENSKRTVVLIKKWRWLFSTVVCGTLWLPVYLVDNQSWWFPLIMFWAGMIYKSFLTWSGKEVSNE